MATASNNDTSNRGLGSNNMDEQTKHEIQSKGGKASAESNKGAAGSTDAARRGGENSHTNQ
jgi:general stress protein YciG